MSWDVTIAPSPPPLIDALRAVAASADVRRRAGALGLAAILHAGVLWLLIVLPPAIPPEVKRAAGAISVRFYTVAGGADAQTDAPLFEPPLAGGRTGADTGQAGGGEDGAEDGPASTRIEPEEADPAPQARPEPEPVIEPEPETAAPPEPVEEPGADSGVEAPVASSSAPDGRRTAAPDGAGPSTSRPQSTAPRTARPADPGAPVATTQPPAEPGPAGTGPSGSPSFADILARARTRLDPDDFRLLADMGDGVRATVRDNFCLSSVDANREAFDCPDGPNAEAARLARYGLQGLGEEPPEFLEDMDRLAYQLSTLGADDNAVTRILTTLRESRREALNTPPLVRQQRRDRRESMTDNLGNPVDGPPMPGGG
jgi:hypothetical protein